MDIKKTTTTQVKRGMQAAKALATDEALETIKSVQKQFGLPEIADRQGRSEYVTNMAQEMANASYDRQVHDQENRAKLESLQRRLAALQEQELQQAAYVSRQKSEEWEKASDQALRGDKKEEQPYRPAIETGSKKRSGVFSAIKNIVTKSETGRKKG